MSARPNPHDVLLGFFETAYQTGARTAGWDIDAFSTRTAPHRAP